MDSQSISKPGYLAPSPLGTKEYWDQLYTSEMRNHATNPADLGTIWFDDAAAEEKVLAFLHSAALGLDHERASFLDLGTGNGHFLGRLREGWCGDGDGGGGDEDNDDDDNETNDDSGGNAERRKRRSFTGRLVGTDYSLPSIEFAQRIAAAASSDHALLPRSVPAIEFLHVDITAPEAAVTLLKASPTGDGFDVVLDKGTFDAVCLAGAEVDGDGDGDGDCVVGQSENEKNEKRKKQHLCAHYRDRILPLVKEGGIFLVTSCNWTEEELRAWFEGEGEDEHEDAGDGGGEGEGSTEEQHRRDGPTTTSTTSSFVFVFETALRYQRFRFGGREGQSISSVCFWKRRRK